MKKILIGILIGLLIGMAVCFFVNILFSYEFISKRVASLTIKNETRQRVKKIFITHKNGTMEASGLKTNEQICFMFTNAGENSYNVSVTSENNLILKSKEIYFDYGYRGIVTITKSGIIITDNW